MRFYNSKNPVLASLLVYAFSHGLKMRWVHTRRNAAQMVLVKPIWDCANIQFIGNPVGIFQFPIHRDFSIPIRSFCPLPQPTPAIFVKEEAKDIPPRLVRGLLEGYAAENQPFADAFKNRHSDPTTWQAKLGEARGEILKDLKTLPGNTVKSDVEAARAAISGRSEPVGDQKSLSAAELMALPQHEFEALWKKQAAANSKR